MRKIAVLVLIAAMQMSIVSYGEEKAGSINNFEQESDAETLGGWEVEQTTKVTQEAADALNKALEGMTGADYEPIALLATQVVAGTNYAILCKVTPVYPDADGSYCVVYVYSDLEGNAELLRVQELGTTEEEAEGAYIPANDEEVIAGAKDALDKASEELEGITYEPVEVIAYQVVAGTNYLILCKGTPVYPDAESAFYLVTVYEDLEGNAEITEDKDFEFSADDIEAAAESTSEDNVEIDNKEGKSFDKQGRGERSGGGRAENSDEQQAVIDATSEKFDQFTYTDEETGITLEYSLFIPKNYDESETYPLIMFIPDSTGAGKSAKEIVQQYYGADVFASDEDQEKHVLRHAGERLISEQKQAGRNSLLENMSES